MESTNSFSFKKKAFNAPRPLSAASASSMSAPLGALAPAVKSTEVDLSATDSSSKRAVPALPISSTFAAPVSTTTRQPEVTVADSYFLVMFTEDTRKKQKVFQDGVLSIKHREHRIKLLNIEGKDVFSRIMPPNFKCSSGNEIEMGWYLVEVGESLPADKFLAGSVFIHGTDPISEEKPNSSLKRKFAPISISKESEPSKAFKPHTSLRLPIPAQKIVDAPQYLHDPFAVGALVLNADAAGLSKVPDQSKVMKFVIDPKKIGTQIPIVVDPYLSKHLRNHQQDGVQFMFHCVGGARGGCILADDMGLGKTIQTIALIWTLLKQGVNAPFTIKQALVVVPTTLVANWEREFSKWLGRERLRVIALSSNLKPEQQQSALHDFSMMAASFPVLIISYEMLRKHREAISHSCIGLLVCDEGHRLKSSESKTLDCLCGLNIPRRVLLTGTPVQNNLDELFAMCNFVSPGVLGHLAAFRNAFSGPIERGRDRSASAGERELGEARNKELSRICSTFVLRRTRAINSRFLPPRTETVLFCGLSPLQLQIYQRITHSKAVMAALRASSFGEGLSTPALQCMTVLRKLCSHPLLVFSAATNSEEVRSMLDGSDDFQFPQSYSESRGQLELSPLSKHTAVESSGTIAECAESALHISDSGKLVVLDQLLSSIRSTNPSDKCVVVSNHTTTLDLIQQLCTVRGHNVVRLDGQTKTENRMSIVNAFNSAYSTAFVFLLSAKAGGVGLNLIGGNRMILFDADWNPATDEQVMARCWRDGQKKPVFIYRLLSMGTIEEIIFQRQIKKSEFKVQASESAAPAESDFRHFSNEDLRECFELHALVPHCRTFELLYLAHHGSHLSTSASVSQQRVKLVATANEQLINAPLHLGEWKFCADVQHESGDQALSVCLEMSNAVQCIAARSSGADTMAIVSEASSSSTSEEAGPESNLAGVDDDWEKYCAAMTDTNDESTAVASADERNTGFESQIATAASGPNAFWQQIQSLDCLDTD